MFNLVSIDIIRRTKEVGIRKPSYEGGWNTKNTGCFVWGDNRKLL